MSESSLSSLESVIDNNRESDLDITISEYFNKLCNINNSKMPANNQPIRPIPVLDVKNLSIIPSFDGNPNKLHRFISACESILTHYYDRNDPNSFQNNLLLNGILNKLENRAEEVVGINGVDNWDDIKNTLLQNFGDQRDENCLNLDLVNLRQKTHETPQQFYEKIIHLLNTICNYIALHSQSEEEKIYKRDFFTKQALKSFLAGLKDPLGPTIRAMRPTSLAQAMQFINEENNIKYYQNNSNPAFKNPNPPFSQQIARPKLNTQQMPIFQPMNFQQRQHFPQYSQYPQFQQFPQHFSSNQFPRGPIDIRPIANPPQRRLPTNSQVFGKPQNVWKPRPQTPQPRPQPMSVCASTSNMRTPQFGQQNTSNNRYNHFANQTRQARPGVIIEEVFNTEFSEQPTEDYATEPELENSYTEEDQGYSCESYHDEHPQNFQEPLCQNETT